MHPRHPGGKFVNVVVADDMNPTPARQATHLEMITAPQNAIPAHRVTLLATETRGNPPKRATPPIASTRSNCNKGLHGEADYLS